MARLRWSLAVVLVPAILGLAGLLLARAAPPTPAGPPASAAARTTPATPAPASTHPATPAPASTHRAHGAPRASHAPRRTAHHTGPWAVIAAYYRDISAGRYARAWALINSGLSTGQNYAQFVAGYSCTGTERPAKLSQSGHQVSFRLTVSDNCAGATQYYTGTDTVSGGKIVAAHVTRTG
jgi:hypothetical protein